MLVSIFKLITGKSKKVKSDDKSENSSNGKGRWDVCDRYDELKNKLSNGKDIGEVGFAPDKLEPKLD